MFKLIGGVVVCGFALYGLSKYLKRPVMNLVIHPGSFTDLGRAGDAAAASEGSGSSGDAAPNAPEVDTTPAAA
jgi:hypothetical protein